MSSENCTSNSSTNSTPKATGRPSKCENVNMRQDVTDHIVQLQEKQTRSAMASRKIIACGRLYVLPPMLHRNKTFMFQTQTTVLIVKTNVILKTVIKTPFATQLIILKNFTALIVKLYQAVIYACTFS
jgi:hypothetical protein